MNIQLKKLELTNYRNIEHAVYEFNGNSKIVGDNRIGKTNTLEAIYYLLTDYLLNGSSDITAIKPLKNTRAIVSVSGTFDIDGKTVSIEKKFGEDWVKQRNTGEEVLKGHFTELYYNGVKQSTVRDFDNLFNADFGIKNIDSVKICIPQLLTNPFYIGDMGDSIDWKEIRKLIIELVGDVSDDDVFLNEPTTAGLKPELELANGRLDQVKKKIDGDIKGLNETLIADNAKLDMLSKVTAPSQSEIDGAKLNLKQIDDKIASLRSSTGNREAEVELKNKIAEIGIKIAEERTCGVSTTDNKLLVDLNNKLSALFKVKSEVQTQISDLTYKIQSSESKIHMLNNDKASLLNNYHDLKNSNVETVCPTCNRPLDPEQIEKAKANLESKINEIVAKGKKIASEIEEESNVIHSYKESITKFESQLDDTIKDINSVNAEIEKEKSAAAVPTPSKKIVEFEKEKSNLESQLLEIQMNDDKARAEVNTQIYELEQKKAPFQKVLDDLAYFNRQGEEKQNCELEKKNHEKMLVQKEQLKDMINKFTFTKLQMLDGNVSKVFGNIKFQLIKPNINGGFDTVCKPYIYDPIKKESTTVLWKSGSKSERVATGIAIVEAIKTKLGLSDMPYLFDEGGELSEDTIKTRLVTKSQLICVKVQDNINAPLVLTLS